MSNKVTYIVYSHHHADHLGASSLFGPDVVRVGHASSPTRSRPGLEDAAPLDGGRRS